MVVCSATQGTIPAETKYPHFVEYRNLSMACLSTNTYNHMYFIFTVPTDVKLLIQVWRQI